MRFRNPYLVAPGYTGVKYTSCPLTQTRKHIGLEGFHQDKVTKSRVHGCAHAMGKLKIPRLLNLYF